MSRRSLSQEGLKLIACVCMLLDHGAVALVQDYDAYILLRSIGRIAFPVYCFLLCEGAAYTSNLRRYALRLAVGALLAEIPFDLVIYGRLTLQGQNVMLTLLLGLGALALGKGSPPRKQLAAALVFSLLGEFLAVDYGGMGVALIALLGIARNMPRGKLLQMIMIPLVCMLMPSMQVTVFFFSFPMELLGTLAVLPIAAYQGEKNSRSRAAQWAFYLFYPGHLLVLYFLRSVG